MQLQPIKIGQSSVLNRILSRMQHMPQLLAAPFEAGCGLCCADEVHLLLAPLNQQRCTGLGVSRGLCNMSWSRAC